MDKEPARIHLVPHFHYDPVWIEDQRTYTNNAFELIQGYLDACRRDEGYHVLLSELDYLRPFLTVWGEHRQFFNELVASGRVGTGGAYSEPNETLIQGEALIRNLLYGRLYHEDVIGAKPSVYLPFDVFGHCLQLPQITAKAGFDAVVWSKNIVGAPPLCYAMAPDGTTQLQKHEPYWYYPDSYEELLNTVADGLEHQAVLGLNQDLRLFGHDMAASKPWLIGKSEDLAALDPSIVLSTPGKYMAALKPELQLRRGGIPISGRDFSWFHLGAPLTRADLKTANRLAENRVLSAERWATLASLLGALYPDPALDKAWRQILFGQHHDAITGVSSDIPYLDLLAGFREALDLSTQIEDRSLTYISARVDTTSGKRARQDGAALVVFNPLGWSRTDVCRARVKLGGALASGFRLYADTGREVPVQIVSTGDAGGDSAEIAFIAPDVPSLGYRTFYLAPARDLPPAPAFAPSQEPSIHNDDLTITADPARGGALTSIRSKRLNREFLNAEAGPANEVSAISEQADRTWTPWEIFTTGDIVCSSDSPASVEVLEGPVFSQLRISTTLPERCELTQEVTLYRGLSRIDLRTTVRDYRSEHELLVLTFPLALQAHRLTFEDRFAAIARRPSKGRLDFRTLEEHNLSQCGLAAAQNWVDVGPSPSLHITSGRRRVGSLPLSPCVIVTAADVKERSAAHMLMRALLSRGVTCIHRLDTHDPEDDPAASGFRISLGRGNAYSARLLQDVPQAASRLSEPNGKAAWSGVLLRRPDPSGDWPDVPVLIADSASNGDLTHVAEALAEAITKDQLALPESRDFSELATPADELGLALLNRGSLMASLENDGTLVAPLFHTSAWSTYPWGEGQLDRFFVPEHRHHVYEHALYPHQGDWRRGGVVRAGHEVNTPLRPLQTSVHQGVLPTAFSLVSPDSENLVIAAVKPLGNPLAAHRTSADSNPDSTILVRAYESAGEHLATAIRFPSEPQAAWTTDLTERKLEDLEVAGSAWRRAAGVDLEVPPCGITSLAVQLAAPAEPGPPKDLGPASEPYLPIHSRYWDHNLGAAPVGNLPVSLWIRGPVPVGQNTRFALGLANDSLDREISGTVNMIAPEAWTMIPRQLPYRIPPNTPALYEVMVVVPEDAPGCFIRAVTKQGDQIVQDVIPVGDVQPLQSSLHREGNALTVRVVNPNADYVEGHVSLITPIESWGESVDGVALGAVTPRLHPFRLEAQSQEEFRFAVEGEPPAWAVAKVCWHGNIQYVQEPGD